MFPNGNKTKFWLGWDCTLRQPLEIDHCCPCIWRAPANSSTHGNGGKAETSSVCEDLPLQSLIILGKQELQHICKGKDSQEPGPSEATTSKPPWVHRRVSSASLQGTMTRTLSIYSKTGFAFCASFPYLTQLWAASASHFRSNAARDRCTRLSEQHREVSHTLHRVNSLSKSNPILVLQNVMG